MGQLSTERVRQWSGKLVCIVRVRIKSARESKMTNFSQRNQRCNPWSAPAFKHCQHQSTPLQAFPWYYCASRRKVVTAAIAETVPGAS